MMLLKTNALNSVFFKFSLNLILKYIVITKKFIKKTNITLLFTIILEFSENTILKYSLDQLKGKYCIKIPNEKTTKNHIKKP
ncbi:hypothetical protein [Persephonella sp.]